MADGFWHHTKLPDIDKRLQSFSNLHEYLRKGVMPWSVTPDGRKFIIVSERSSEIFRAQQRSPLRCFQNVPADQFQQLIQARFSQEIREAAVNGLSSDQPEASAFQLFSPRQALVFFTMFCLVFAAFFLLPLTTLITINIALTGYFLATITFRLILFLASLRQDAQSESGESKKFLSDHDLPVITILVPLRDEEKTLPILINALENLDYPFDKLDIKFLLEEDDPTTQTALQNLSLPAHFQPITVPNIGPRTKPKACNFGLYEARGTITVIYDAEDRPEPDQLRKVANGFLNTEDNVICLQAQLSYYNSDENWLTRLFTLEYALWFDCLLPALEKLRVPIPLGGTSNFFLTEKLIEIGGWDPYNVTEDADLGLRLAARGYRTAIIDSTTYEEANCRPHNWIRQRSRWMKGYMQTTCVHLRQPGQFIQQVGIWPYLGMQLFVAGNVISALVNPILWCLFLIWQFTHHGAIARIFPGILLELNLIALLIGNLFFVYLSILAPLKRGLLHLSPTAILTPFYWVMMAWAAYRALWQLIFNRFYWEKTDHGISNATQRQASECQRLRILDKKLIVSNDKGPK